MINGLRKYAYTISALAVACFFLVPDPTLAIIGALLLQTLAFILIAGKSVPDGIVLTGISIMLIGTLSTAHPLIREAFFDELRPWILVTGVVVTLSGVGLILMAVNKRSH